MIETSDDAIKNGVRRRRLGSNQAEAGLEGVTDTHHQTVEILVAFSFVISTIIILVAAIRSVIGVLLVREALINSPSS